MRLLITYALVLPLSFLASRFGAIIIGAPLAFGLIRTSIWLRSTVGGFLMSIGSVVAAVAAGWCIFNWIMGPHSFTFIPFIASLFLLIISIPKNLRIARQQAHTRAEFNASGKQWFADQLGNPWSELVADVYGLILAFAWFIWVYR